MDGWGEGGLPVLWPPVALVAGGVVLCAVVVGVGLEVVVGPAAVVFGQKI